MESQLRPVAEVRAQALVECPVRVQACDLVFVLVTQQAEPGARRHGRQFACAACSRLRCPHTVYQCQVAVGQPFILVCDQECAAALDHRIQCLDDVVHTSIEQFLQRFNVMCGDASPGERTPVLFDVHTVEFNGTQQRIQ